MYFCKVKDYKLSRQNKGHQSSKSSMLCFRQSSLKSLLPHTGGKMERGYATYLQISKASKLRILKFLHAREHQSQDDPTLQSVRPAEKLLLDQQG
uniref:Uncharacterized protein n=1 Tax=Rhizophora mucronata TaxID=61149 RepID=A0A2P2INW9_RHIMU